MLGPRSSTPTPGSRPRCACGSPESGRSTSSPSRTRTGTASTAAKSYRVTLPPDIPAARFWSLTAIRQPDALDAPDAAALPAAGSQADPTPAATAERRRLDDRHVQSGATRGYPGGQLDPDRRRARAGSRSCGSTARSSRSSTSPGDRARWSPWASPARTPSEDQPPTERKPHVPTERHPDPGPACEHDPGLHRRVQPRVGRAHACSHRCACCCRCPARVLPDEPRSDRGSRHRRPSGSAASLPQSRRSSAQHASRPRPARSSRRSTWRSKSRSATGLRRCGPPGSQGEETMSSSGGVSAETVKSFSTADQVESRLAHDS